MELILMFWLSGDPVLQVGPIAGAEACAALQAEISAEIALGDPEELVPFGNAMVALKDIAVTCEPVPVETCPVPDELPEFVI